MRTDTRYGEHRAATPHVSLLVPVYNEENSVNIFLARIEEVLGQYKGPLEILFVNDGSTDNTRAVVEQAAAENPAIKLVNLSRNFGKEAALTAGLDYSLGDVVIPMDVDLQDPPELVPDMIAKWQEGYDVVNAVRSSRHEDSASKRITAGLFYRFFNWISDISIPENAGDFRLMDRKVVNTVKLFPERNRFMKGLFAWAGFKSVNVEYSRSQRASGESKWNYWRLWNFALDGFLSFSTVPLRIWSYVGAFISLCAFIYIAVVVIRVFLYGIDVPGYASLMTVILFFGGIQLLSIGIIGEYIGRIFMETKSRPVYVVESIVTSDDLEKAQPQSSEKMHTMR